MKLKCPAFCSSPKAVDFTLLLMRVVVGIAFMIHGWGKIQNPFAWAGPESPIPGLFLGLAALAEFGGGLALILGLLTRLASFGIACTMLVAVYMHMIVMGDPFVSNGGGSYELAAVFLSIALFLIANGPGRYSIDHKFCGHKN